VETALELWVSSLREVKQRIRPLFLQERMAHSAGLFLDALLGPERRKTGWMRAEAASDSGPWRQQTLLGRACWNADALRDVVGNYVVETLSDADAVLVIDETGFLKQGKTSCGVSRQYTGSAGKITCPKGRRSLNCQIGVFAAYVSCHGHVFIDRSLYLPKTWTDAPARMTAAHVPPATAFATKPQLARVRREPISRDHRLGRLNQPVTRFPGAGRGSRRGRPLTRSRSSNGNVSRSPLGAARGAIASLTFIEPNAGE
jgi:SRSO17 transposase